MGQLPDGTPTEARPWIVTTELYPDLSNRSQSETENIKVKIRTAKRTLRYKSLDKNRVARDTAF